MESYVDPYEAQYAEPKAKAVSADPLDLSNLDDLAPHEEPFTYKGKNYVLTEAGADASVKWRNAVMKATKFSNGKVSSVENMADTEPYLVSMCLYEELANGKRKSLTTVEVRSTFSNRVMKRLYDKVIAISDLKEEPKTLKEKVAAARKDLKKLEKEYADDLAEKGETEASDSSDEGSGDSSKN